MRLTPSVSSANRAPWPKPRKPRPRLLAVLGLVAAASATLSLMTPGARAATHAARATADTVWLCKPGTADDPCTASLETSVVPANGATTVKTGKINPASKFDCFYIYPTVSQQSTPNSNLVVQPAETEAAEEQAAWFSTVCRVWAPMYRQVTFNEILSANLTANSAPIKIAYRSLLSGFEDYLRHYNDGRPIIFLSHSQGSVMLIRLLQNLVERDHRAALRSRIVYSVILGGNVVVPNGALEGGSFSDIPVCTWKGETGCYIAYSSFPGEPPAAAVLGRPGQGISILAGQTATKGVHVVCVNPANMSGSAPLTPYFLTEGTLPTPWVEYPRLYRGGCESRGGATWLQVSKMTGPSDTRPVVTERLGPDWGYHGADVNLELGDLLRDTAAAEHTWEREHPMA
jgi:hypothetical protein